MPNLTSTQTIQLISDKAILSVTLSGNAHGETIILLHGGPGVPVDMTEAAGALTDYYRIVTFDQRGTGDSSCDDGVYSIEKYLSDIESIARHLNIEQFHLFGHSWGGLYAQIYAQNYPQKIKSLFLSSPSSGTGDAWKETEQEVMNFNKSRTTTWGWLQMGWNSLLGMLGSDKAYGKLFKQVIQNYHKGYNANLPDDDWFKKLKADPINKTRKAILSYPPLNISKNPSFPILVAYGSNDIYGISKQLVHERFPTATFIEIQACGHIPWKHNPVEFDRIAREFYLEKS